MTSPTVPSPSQRSVASGQGHGPGRQSSTATPRDDRGRPALTPSTNPGARRGPQWLRLARRMLAVHGIIGLSVLGIGVVVAVLVLWLVSRYARPEMSALQFANQLALWTTFGLTIAVASSYLPAHVAAGMTRRSFFRGMVLAGAVAALGYGVALTLLLLAERAAYDALGWFHGSDDATDVTVLGDGIWPVLGGLVLIFLAGSLSGLLVALTYYRLSGWATFLIPLTVLVPIVGVAVLSAPPQAAPWTVEVDATPLGIASSPLGIVLALLILAATALAAWLTVKDIPIGRVRQ